MNLRSLRTLSVATAAMLALAACGEEEQPTAAATATPATPAETGTPEPEPTARAERRGTKIVLAESRFGSMLFNAKRQAIYIFEKDPKDKTVCFGECAEAWPPVFTKGEPVAGDGVRRSLLGTIERRDGGRQVTYAGKPLYYYANEGPGEVKCHNVFLNGGLWWAIGPNGKRLA